MRGSRKRLVGLGECSRVLSNKEVEGKDASVAPEEGQSLRTGVGVREKRIRGRI